MTLARLSCGGLREVFGLIIKSSFRAASAQLANKVCATHLKVISWRQG